MVGGSAGHLRVVATHGQALPKEALAILEKPERLPVNLAVESLRAYGCSRVVFHPNWFSGANLNTTIEAVDAAGLPVLWESKESVVFSLSP